MASVFFEEIRPGLEFPTALSEPFSTEAVELYIKLTGDRFHIHTDDRFAREFGLRAAMVPGNFIVARATGLVYEAGYFSDSLVVQARKSTRFVQPLYIGERIYVVDTVVSVDDRVAKPYGRVVIERQTLSDCHRTIQITQQDYRIMKRAAPEVASAAAGAGGSLAVVIGGT